MVRLSTLTAPFSGLRAEGGGDPDIVGVRVDSRSCGRGDVFVAVGGTSVDGHRFVPDALAAGCAAVVVRDPAAARLAADAGVAVMRVDDPRPWPARLARELHRRPDEALRVVGVTGTNGKTTTAWLLRELLGSVSGGCGLLGTIRYETGARRVPAPLTTPDGPALYGMLAEMRDHDLGAVALELSSHALDQSRAADLSLDAAVMTNLSRDHLDYHPSLAAYLAAKARILDLLGGERRAKAPGVAVINVDDAAFAALPADPAVRVVRYGAGAGAELRLIGTDLHPDGTDLRFDWRGRPLELHSGLVGRFNVENLTAALATGLALDLGPDACLAALSAAGQVPGRIERFPLPNGASAVVDYAHTPDALAAVLASCRDFTAGRLVVVFGCGGDRDRGKRADMGAVAARLADDTWITSDNPRTEDPQSICDMIYYGFRAETDVRSGDCRVDVDRTRAVRGALASAVPGDVIVIAGKGHEDYQIVGDLRLHLDDRELVRDWIGEATRG